MKPQNYEVERRKIVDAFETLKKENPKAVKKRIKLSWSNWGFGMEPLDVSLERLSKADVEYIELHGNHYGPDLGYRPKAVKAALKRHGIRASGVCGMFSADCDLSSNRAVHRQAAIDYLRREIEFTAEMGGSYLLVVPGAVGRPTPYDAMEFDRSVETLRLVADKFLEHGVKAAIEPIRSAEVSFVHTIADAIRYIDAVNHNGVGHINGDVYHMQVEESHIASAIVQAGKRLVNLHMADSNRGALGSGSLDLDAIIMALHLIGFGTRDAFVSPEPLGPGGDPYPAMYGKPDPASLDDMVNQTVKYFREREACLLEC